MMFCKLAAGIKVLVWLVLVKNVLLQQEHFAQASEEMVGNAGRCSSMQDPKKELNCRKARAGGQECFDRTKCSDPSTMEQVMLHVPPPKEIIDVNTFKTEPTGNVTLYGPQDTVDIETYNSAVVFCKAKGHDGVAYLVDYCKGGEYGELVFDAPNQDEWSPVGDCSGCYVQVGDGGQGTAGHKTCVLHTTVAGGNPTWGMEVGKRREEANYILCVDLIKEEKNTEGDSTNRLEEQIFGGNSAPLTGTNFISVFQCSDYDAARRIGMTCDSFPYYNGGYPMLAGGIKWDDEWESYQCLQANNNNTETFCSQWSTKEDSVDEYELGLFECQQISSTQLGIPYCKKWTSQQRETKKCGVGVHSCVPNCEEPTFCRQTCCTETEGGGRSCYDCSYIPFSEYEYSTAVCHNVSDQGACLYWNQEEYDEHNYYFREYEEYTCMELSKNEAYCRRWFGNIDSEEEFEISTCQCLDEDEDGNQQFCYQWVCYEQGLSYFFPNYVWTLLVLLVCAVLIFPICITCIREGEWSTFLCWYCFFFVTLGIAVAFLCGFMGVIIIFCLCWFLYPCVVYFYMKGCDPVRLAWRQSLDFFRSGFCLQLGKVDKQTTLSSDNTTPDVTRKGDLYEINTDNQDREKPPEYSYEPEYPMAAAICASMGNNGDVPIVLATVTSEEE